MIRRALVLLAFHYSALFGLLGSCNTGTQGQKQLFCTYRCKASFYGYLKCVTRVDCKRARGMSAWVEEYVRLAREGNLHDNPVVSFADKLLPIVVFVKYWNLKICIKELCRHEYPSDWFYCFLIAWYFVNLKIVAKNVVFYVSNKNRAIPKEVVLDICLKDLNDWISSYLWTQGNTSRSSSIAFHASRVRNAIHAPEISLNMLFLYILMICHTQYFKMSVFDFLDEMWIAVLRFSVYRCHSITISLKSTSCQTSIQDHQPFNLQ